MQEERKSLWLQNQFLLILTERFPTVKHKVARMGMTCKSSFKNLLKYRKVTNRETFVNKVSSTSNKNRICTDDCLS